MCIRNGWADFGGGISGSSQSLTIRNCCFDGCIALYQGGGIAWYGAISPVIVEGCRFTRNGAAAGGAIFRVVAASDTLFMKNRANLGGAVYLEYMGGRFTRCRFEDNTGSEGGGAVAVTPDADIQLFDCEFTGNSTDGEGGAVRFLGTYLSQIQSSRFMDNYAGSGGAIYSGRGSLILSDCILTRNRAITWGGGVRGLGSLTYISLKRCVFADNLAGSHGGAIEADNRATVHCEDTIITHNTAQYEGGAVALYYNCTARFIRCHLSDNFAWRDGGAFFLNDCDDVSINSCTIERNRALASGGVMLCDVGSAPQFTGSNLVANSAARDGGAVACRAGSSPTFIACNLIGNVAENCGGVMYAYDNSSPTLQSCTVAYNRAGNSGGAVYAYYYCSPTIAQCILSDNQTAYYGGGLYCEWSSSPIVINSVFTANSARYSGGGMYIYRNSAPRIINCTVAYNSASNHGGGIYSYNSTPEVVNTVVALNSSGIYRSGGSLTLRHNCVWGNTSYNYKGVTDPTGTNGNISADPLLTGHNAHLLPSSPCINAGDNGAVVSGWDDIDDEARLADGQVDIGADEFSPPTVNGILSFGDYAGRFPVSLAVEIRAGTVSFFRDVHVGSDGSFTLSSAPAGTFQLAFKPSHWLRRVVDVGTSQGSVWDVQVALANSDIDGDNEVTLFDFGALVASFGSLPGDASWNPNADLDGDEEVTLFDFGVLVRNFGLIGDE